jgi:RNA polymerase sigma-32 factor
MPPINARLTYRQKQPSQRKAVSAAEERELAERWKHHNDERALEALISLHMGLVVTIAREFRYANHLLDDLKQEGYLGLTIAARRFDPDRGTRLVTYATYWIRARILDFILRSHGPVRIGTTRAQRRVYFGLARARRELEGRGLDPDALRLAEVLGVADREVEWMATRLAARDLALDAQAAVSRVPALTDGTRSPEEILADSEELAFLQAQLYEVLRELDGRERRIVFAHHLRESPTSLASIALELGVTRERVRQLRDRALKRLRDGNVGKALASFAA